MVESHLNIQSLCFSIGNQFILKDVQLNLQGNQVVALLGPNGAGKSTLLKSMASHLCCQSGTVDFNGFDSKNDRIQYLSQVGYMPENALIISELSVLEQLQLVACSQLMDDCEGAINDAIGLCQLNSVVNKRTKHLSLGYKQRLNFAMAILNNPKLIVLDEPLNGLDPHLIIEFRAIINQLKNNSIIVMSTHYLAEAQNVSDSLLIMNRGVILDQIILSEYPIAMDLEKIYLQRMQGVNSL